MILIAKPSTEIKVERQIPHTIYLGAARIRPIIIQTVVGGSGISMRSAPIILLNNKIMRPLSSAGI
jgi:hypothetical protein